MTDEEIIEAMARAIFRCKFNENEDEQVIAQCWNEWDREALMSHTQARAAFAIARARIREHCAEVADGINQLGGSAGEVAAALRNPKNRPDDD